MSTINGLPAHVLLVHAVVVLVPLTALLLVLTALWPAARRRLSLFTAVLALVTLITVPLTTNAGEWLERRVPETPLVRTHTDLGDNMLPWALGLFVVAAAVAVRQILAARATAEQDQQRSGFLAGPGGAAMTVIVALLALVVSVGSVVQVYRIGESGARAAWTGQFTAQPHPRAAQPQHEG